MDDFGVVKTVISRETISQKNDQEQLDDAVIQYFIAEAGLLNAIFRPSFRRLVERRYGKAKLFGKSKLRPSIQETFQQLKINLKEQLKVTNDAYLT